MTTSSTGGCLTALARDGISDEDESTWLLVKAILVDGGQCDLKCTLGSPQDILDLHAHTDSRRMAEGFWVHTHSAYYGGYHYCGHKLLLPWLSRHECAQICWPELHVVYMLTM